MTKACAASGCSSPASSRYGRYCDHHRARFRRHGHPEQQSIRGADLAPYLQLVQKRIDKNPESPAWSQLAERWLLVLGQARAVRSLWEKGKPGNRYARLAANEVERLALSVDALRVIKTCIATFMLRDFDPRRFKSENAFRTQLVRRVVRLAPSRLVGHPAKGVPKIGYGELAPKTVAVIAEWLISAFGAASLRLASRERKDHEKAIAAIADLASSLDSLE
jgi:hypothetical protein